MEEGVVTSAKSAAKITSKMTAKMPVKMPAKISTVEHYTAVNSNILNLKNQKKFFKNQKSF